MEKLDMFLYIFGEIDKFGWLYLKILSKYAEFQDKCQTYSVHFDVSISKKSGNERTKWSGMDNVIYNYTLAYDTCDSFISVY